MLQPFALGEVTLGPGLLADKAGLMLDHLRSYDADRLLRAFRENAGLPTPDVPRPGGWEDTAGEANGNLRGHYTGHFLSALAQAAASTGETRDPDCAEFGRLLDLDVLIDACAAGKDVLEGCTPTSTSRSSPGWSGGSRSPARSGTWGRRQLLGPGGAGPDVQHRRHQLERVLGAGRGDRRVIE